MRLTRKRKISVMGNASLKRVTLNPIVLFHAAMANYMQETMQQKMRTQNKMLTLYYVYTDSGSSPVYVASTLYYRMRLKLVKWVIRQILEPLAKKILRYCVTHTMPIHNPFVMDYLNLPYKKSLKTGFTGDSL